MKRKAGIVDETQRLFPTLFELLDFCAATVQNPNNNITQDDIIALSNVKSTQKRPRNEQMSPTMRLFLQSVGCGHRIEACKRLARVSGLAYNANVMRLLHKCRRLRCFSYKEWMKEGKKGAGSRSVHVLAPLSIHWEKEEDWFEMAAKSTGFPKICAQLDKEARHYFALCFVACVAFACTICGWTDACSNLEQVKEIWREFGKDCWAERGMKSEHDSCGLSIRAGWRLVTEVFKAEIEKCWKLKHDQIRSRLKRKRHVLRDGERVSIVDALRYTEQLCEEVVMSVLTWQGTKLDVCEEMYEVVATALNNLLVRDIGLGRRGETCPTFVLDKARFSSRVREIEKEEETTVGDSQEFLQHCQFEGVDAGEHIDDKEERQRWGQPARKRVKLSRQTEEDAYKANMSGYEASRIAREIVKQLSWDATYDDDSLPLLSLAKGAGSIMITVSGLH